MSLYADIDSTLFWVTQETSIPAGVRESAQLLRLRLADKEKQDARLTEENQRQEAFIQTLATALDKAMEFVRYSPHLPACALVNHSNALYCDCGSSRLQAEYPAALVKGEQG